MWASSDPGGAKAQRREEAGVALSPAGDVVSEDGLWDVEQRSRGLPGGQTGLERLRELR